MCNMSKRTPAGCESPLDSQRVLFNNIPRYAQCMRQLGAAVISTLGSKTLRCRAYLENRQQTQKAKTDAGFEISTTELLQGPASQGKLLTCELLYTISLCLVCYRQFQMDAIH